VLADPAPCTPCMLKIALLALWQREPDRAAIALERARQSTEITRNKSTLHTYYLLTGQLLMQQGRLKDAQGVLRAALALAPEDAETKEVLNSALTSERQEIPTHQ
jgi:tetratricopeptide (TPR) repeat protein